MGAPLALAGQRFGRLVVRGVGAKSQNGARRWVCVCDCGTERLVDTHALSSGITVSCGCFQREQQSVLSRKHGGTGTPEYKAWQSVKERCFNKNSKVFPAYGGRGISMCVRWRDSFEAFLHDMGKRPTHQHSLDRIDNDLGYEPGNCRWATHEQQANNKRSNIIITMNGVRHTLSQACISLGISSGAVRSRFRAGKSLVEALGLHPDGVVAMSRRKLDWSQALREIKSDRLARQPVREERLRVAQGLRGAPALALSAWRGRSGRRYVVGVHPIDTFDIIEADQAVALFVRRDDLGVSTLLSCSNSPDALDAGLLVTRAKLDGCTEVHIHRLAEDDAERAAIISDLNVVVLEVA